MSNKTEVEQATDIIDKRLHSFTSGAIACALSAAGLLRTDADKLNAELAEAMVAYPDDGFTFDSYSSPKWKRICDARNAILDARKPSPRFRYFNASYVNKTFPWVVADGPDSGAEARAYFRTEPEAQAYVEHLNAEGAK